MTGWDDGWRESDDLSPEEVAAAKRGIQDARLGFGYEFLKIDGRYWFRCLKCQRLGDVDRHVGEPFPHRSDCPMRSLTPGEDD